MASESIKIVSDDEADVILRVAYDMAVRLGWPSSGRVQDFPLKSIGRLTLQQSLSFGSVGPFDPRPISRDDLTALALYIDDWLNGNLPPFELPAEYDRRIEFLSGFKQRVVASGVWPNTK